jgi:hypothetical protein
MHVETGILVHVVTHKHTHLRCMNSFILETQQQLCTAYVYPCSLNIAITCLLLTFGRWPGELEEVGVQFIGIASLCRTALLARSVTGAGRMGFRLHGNEVPVLRAAPVSFTCLWCIWLLLCGKSQSEYFFCFYCPLSDVNLKSKCCCLSVYM